MGNVVLSLTLPGMGVLAIAGVGCLIFCKEEENYKHLVRTAVVFVTAFVLYFGGIILLDSFHLTWRNAPAAVLCGVLLVSGWMGITFTLVCLLPQEWKGMPAVLRWVFKGAVLLFAAVVLLVTLWIGPIGIAFVYGESERVVEHQDRLLLEKEEGFMSEYYSYYEYHGPLVRGTERIFNVEDAVK